MEPGQRDLLGLGKAGGQGLEGFRQADGRAHEEWPRLGWGEGHPRRNQRSEARDPHHGQSVECQALGWRHRWHGEETLGDRLA